MLQAADTLQEGDTILRYGVKHTIKRVSIGRSGNVEVDYIDGCIEDLDPSAYIEVDTNSKES